LRVETKNKSQNWEQSKGDRKPQIPGGAGMKPVIKNIEDLAESVVGDGSRLRQIFHPAQDPLAIDFSLSSARLAPGVSTKEHFLAQSETYLILVGEGTLVLDGASYPVKEGSAVWVPPGCSQWLRNDGPEELRFLVVVDPPWTAEGDSA
jgi:mannose-6-phosphate isomerase-like protein (cupin superfamily)